MRLLCSRSKGLHRTALNEYPLQVTMNLIAIYTTNKPPICQFRCKINSIDLLFFVSRMMQSVRSRSGNWPVASHTAKVR